MQPISDSLYDMYREGAHYISDKYMNRVGTQQKEIIFQIVFR